MASTTDDQRIHTHPAAQVGSDGVRNKDSSMPQPDPPPSPPVTETDTDPESPLSTTQPVSSAHEPNRTTAQAEDHITSPRQDGDGAVRSLDTSTQGIETPNAGAEADGNAQSPVTSPVTSPPYWTAHNGQEYRTSHGRSVSSASADSFISAGRGITLRDNENSSIDDRGSACWARSVQVTDYVTVNGSATNIGAFVVWNIRVETLSGSYMNIRKRYSEFDDFRWRLMRTFPGFEAAVPELPPKGIISKFRPKFLEKRRTGLQYFLNCIILNPEFSGSPVLKDFLFS
ncbi:Phox homologous domain-containing protein [Nemania sp. FL0916]|nr:Phox homologous domain-containing protein [Nemania sp. FL0916]